VHREGEVTNQEISLRRRDGGLLVVLNHSRAAKDEGGKEKPVGTVCFGYADKTGVLHSERYCFADLSREQVRQQACLQAMRGIMTLL